METEGKDSGIMAFGWFGKKKDSKPAGDGASPGGSGDASLPNGGGAGEPPSDGKGGKTPPLPPRDPRKAEAFFRHGRGVAHANFEYAIEMFIKGLAHDPDNMRVHEELRDVALRRKVAGGKPAPMSIKLARTGPTALDKMLQTELIWAYDPLNKDMMLNVMERAVEADAVKEEKANIGEVAYFFGEMVFDQNRTSKPLNQGDLIKLATLFRSLEKYDKAIEAAKYALQMDLDSADLRQFLKDLETERTMAVGGFNDVATGGNFQASVGNMEKQKELDAADRLDTQAVNVVATIEKIIVDLRVQVEAKPEDVDLRNKLVENLLKRDTTEHQNEAITQLELLYKTTGQYRFKFRVGDIKMSQWKRRVAAIKEQREKNAEDPELKAELDEVTRQKNEFELAEFEERTKEYPTEMVYRFELAQRLIQVKRYDEAIGYLQQAQIDPKRKSMCLYLLGYCYRMLGMFEESVDSYRRGVDAHANPNDKTGLEMRYGLMDALEQRAIKNTDLEAAKEGMKLASQIIQVEFTYKDIRSRLARLRKFIEDQEKKKSEGVGDAK